MAKVPRTRFHEMVMELCYGCGGCLDGFVVEVESGCAKVKRRFECEGELRKLIKRCWERGDRIKLTVGRKSGEIREVCLLRLEEKVIERSHDKCCGDTKNCEHSCDCENGE